MYFFKKNKVRKEKITPFVSLIIAAYNEEKVIEKKIYNSLKLDYPSESIEIIVVSDGSNDKTPIIVEKFRDSKIFSLFEPQRKGKTAALNRAVGHANGDIIIFSDANSMYESNAIKMLVSNFYDTTVGGVCGRKSIIKNLQRESSRGDSFFWNFESFIKTIQSYVGSISTGDGEIFAIRKNLYSLIPEIVINDDTAITFNIVEKGYRVVYEPEAISWEEASTNIEDDFNVKARMVFGGYQTLCIYSRMLFPPKSYFAFQFISHKMLRWLMPFLLIGLFISNYFISYGFYIFFWLLQIGFYSIALTGYVMRKNNHEIGYLYFPFYYCTMNIAALLGFIYFLRKESITSIWKKADR